MTELESTFISLVKLGIGTSAEESVPLNTDWDSLMALAVRQGLSAVVLDGIGHIPEQQRPEKNLLLQWIGDSIQNYENRYSTYTKAISRLAGFYIRHGLKMMVLKGLACGLDWPIPEHRPYGDIDIWLFGKQKEADVTLKKEKGIEINSSHHHHTVFYWQEFMVENHYDFINVHHHKSNAELEHILKKMGQDDSHYVDISGERVFIPSPDLHALFLLRHAMAHFASTEITVRHLLDWAFFIEKNTKQINWKWLMGVLDRFGMTDLFHIFNVICIEDLGFDANLFPHGSVNSQLKNRVLLEIINPEFSAKMPSNLIKRVVWKYRRWRANAWKHSLCYKESLWSAFWSGIWSHLLKPSSI